VCEWLNTVELLKSEFTNDIISPKKLKIINNNCKKVRDKSLLSKLIVSCKFLKEKNKIKIEHPKLKNNE
tara:strand:- start:1437 stop:1643 length:207 start_codon:yes stop_codon:yes gene_type:complete